MQDPIRYRGDIPFYHDKTAAEFRQDPYERYDPMVIRQAMIYLSDDMWGRYPMQLVQDYIESHITNDKPKNILEIGCGVGRNIATISVKYPKAECWGIDFSYQMLKCANDTWVKGISSSYDFSKFGFGDNLKVQSRSLSNLNFGLAKGESLPFEDDSQDIVFSSFLLDRLDDPIQGLREMKRVVRPSEKVIIITPLNFNTNENWENLYPSTKLRNVIIDMGYKIVDWQEDMMIDEPLDARGNRIQWRCIGVVLR